MDCIESYSQKRGRKPKQDHFTSGHSQISNENPLEEDSELLILQDPILELPQELAILKEDETMVEIFVFRSDLFFKCEFITRLSIPEKNEAPSTFTREEFWNLVRASGRKRFV